MSVFTLGGKKIKPGERARVSLTTAPLFDFTATGVPVEVVRGKQDGPVLFVCAAIHGDEINGVDIVKRVLSHPRLRYIRGTLIAVPIVNVYGFNTKSRYLPDRRDLNRCFPGDADGSLASQIAHSFMQEIVSKSTHGIDLHTGAVHRCNLPQVRGCFDDEATRKLAEAFGVPVMIHSTLRDGSLREAARQRKIPLLLFEGGEALRFNEGVTRVGVRGVLNVMEAIGMLPRSKTRPKHPAKTFHAQGSYWLRAPYSGILEAKKHLGDRVKKGQRIGAITDPFGSHRFDIRAGQDGIIIGMSMMPLFNQGDAVFHIATFENPRVVEENIDHYTNLLQSQADTYVT